MLSGWFVPKITKLCLNLSKLCLECCGFFFPRHSVCALFCFEILFFICCLVSMLAWSVQFCGSYTQWYWHSNESSRISHGTRCTGNTLPVMVNTWLLVEKHILLLQIITTCSLFNVNPLLLWRKYWKRIGQNVSVLMLLLGGTIWQPQKIKRQHDVMGWPHSGYCHAFYLLQLWLS